MKISICSDLHLEFGDLLIKNTEGADVLILAGDITVAAYLDQTKTHLTSGERLIAKNTVNFFENVCKEFKHVVYVLGNHEHYKGDYANTYCELKKFLPFDNLHILENETFEIGDYIFVGGTMWTDCNGSDPMSIMKIKSVMNDFSVIENSNYKAHRWNMIPIYKDGIAQLDDNGKPLMQRKATWHTPKLSPQDTIEAFHKFNTYLKEVIDKNPNKKVVVVTHHSPTRQSVHALYRHDYMLNGGYSSNLDFFIEDNPNIVGWFCGHTHYRFNFNIGNCRVILNPRGYMGYEPQANDFKPLTIDI